MKLIKPFKPVHSTSRNRVVVLCGDSQVGLWAVRSLGRKGLDVYAICRSERGLAACSRYTRGAWALEAYANAESFVDDVERLARELNAGSVMPIDESHHSALIQQRDRLEPAIHLFSPPAGCFQKAIDKAYLHKLCTELGIPVARGTTLEQFWNGNGTKLQYPVVLRTRNQNLPDGRRRAPWKAAYAVNEEQLEELYRGVEGIASNILVQEYHPGVESHVQILMHRGEAFMALEYIGEHHMPLAGGVTVQRITCYHENLVRDAIQLLKAIEWEGVAAVQFHFDPATGNYIFLEINPRFCGGLPTVIRAGFDAPYLLWQSHFEPDAMQARRYRRNYRTRILGGDANWMLGMMRGDTLPPDQKRLSKLSALGRFMWNFGPWTRDDVFLWSDPMPFLRDCRNMVKRFIRKDYDLIGT